ncbi:MAG TPA: hypothetical protein VNK82_13815 [Terriglobales bacterium]|nr:hypothetical protein [Terriglobales bacterium]
MPIAPEVLTMAVDITKETIRSSGGKLEEPEKVAKFLEEVCHKLDELRWMKSVSPAG